MKKSWMFLALLLGALVIAGVLLSNFQKEIGLAEPSSGAKAAVAAAIYVEQVAADPSTDYREYAEALRVALVAHKRLALRNPIDPQVRVPLGRALECYSAAREAWQAEVEGEWDDSTYGDPSHWNAIHPDIAEELGLEAGEQPLTADDVRAAYFAAASRYLDEARALTSE